VVKFGNLKKYLYLCTNYEDMIFIKDKIIFLKIKRKK